MDPDIPSNLHDLLTAIYCNIPHIQNPEYEHYGNLKSRILINSWDTFKYLLMFYDLFFVFQAWMHHNHKFLEYKTDLSVQTRMYAKCQQFTTI